MPLRCGPQDRQLPAGPGAPHSGPGLRHAGAGPAQPHPGSTPSPGARAGLPDHRMGALDHVGRGQRPPELLRQSGPGRHEDPAGASGIDPETRGASRSRRRAGLRRSVSALPASSGCRARRSAWRQPACRRPGRRSEMFLPSWTRQRRMADTCPEGPPDRRTQCPGAVRHEQAAHGRIEPPAGRATCRCLNRGPVPGSSFHHSGGMLVATGAGADGRSRQEVGCRMHATCPDDRQAGLRDVRRHPLAEPLPGRCFDAAGRLPGVTGRSRDRRARPPPSGGRQSGASAPARSRASAMWPIARGSRHHEPPPGPAAAAPARSPCLEPVVAPP